MKRLSLQWRITLMSVLLIGTTCVAMNLLLCSSGMYYMDTIADSLQGGGTVILNDGGAASFDPQLIAPNEELIIVVDGVQGRFRTTNWYITAAVTLLSGIPLSIFPKPPPVHKIQISPRSSPSLPPQKANPVPYTDIPPGMPTLPPLFPAEPAGST